MNKIGLMPLGRALARGALTALVVFALPAAAANSAADTCLGQAEQRAAVAEQEVLPLAALKISRRRREKLLNVRLCRRGERLVYKVTWLKGRGMVKRRIFDAKTGKPTSDLVNSP